MFLDSLRWKGKWKEGWEGGVSDFVGRDWPPASLPCQMRWCGVQAGTQRSLCSAAVGCTMWAELHETDSRVSTWHLWCPIGKESPAPCGFFSSADFPQLGWVSSVETQDWRCVRIALQSDQPASGSWVAGGVNPAVLWSCCTHVAALGWGVRPLWAGVLTDAL